MTHTLHREGSLESLKDDYLLFIAPDPKVNSKGSCGAVKKFFELCLKHNCIGIAERRSGSNFTLTIDEIKRSIRDGSYVFAVFDDSTNYKNLLIDLKDEELGYSLIATGVTEKLLDMCKEIGIKPHSITQSLGTFGNIKLIPDGPELELITMCGHMLVSKKLIDWVVGEIKEKRISCQEGALILAEPCLCGIFNTTRASRLLMEITQG